MSGYKRATVSLSQEEYDRLREAEEKLRHLPEPQPETKIIIQQQSNKQLEINLEQMQQRQRSFEQMVAGLGGYIQDMEERTNQSMFQLESQAINAAQQYVGSLQQYMDAVMTEQQEQFASIVAANHRQNQEELAQISRQLRRQAAGQEQKRDLAEGWLEAAESFCGFIRQNYAHDYFLPGRVDQMETQLIQARYNLEFGLSEAVVVMSQQLYRAFSEVRLELEQMQAEWSILFQAAWEAINQLLSLAGSCRVVPAVDLDGALLDYEIDTDFWSDGKLEQLIQRLCTIRDQLEAVHATPDAPALRSLLDNELPAYRASLDECVLDARIHAINSQLRINIADLVVCALQEQGFSLDGFAYDQEDMRQGFGARLTNIEGSEVILKVTPSGSEIGENELQIQSLDRMNRTEHELRQRWYEVSRSLTAYGIQVGQYQQSDSPVKRHARAPMLPTQRTAVRQQQPGR